MNLEKLKLKAVMAESMGRDFEKDVERARTKFFKLQGANEALVAAVKVITDHVGVTKDKIISGDIKMESNDEIGLAKLVVAQLQGVVRKLHDMAELAHTNSIRADGERAAFEDSAKKCKSVFDEEVQKLQNLEKQIQDGTVKLVDGDLMFIGDGPRPPGTHPGPTLKVQRQAEEAAEAEAGKGNGVGKKTRRRKAKTEASDDRNT
jgi:hypothetical protein